MTAPEETVTLIRVHPEVGALYEKKSELQRRLRAISEERLSKWQESAITRWIQSGAQAASFLLFGYMASYPGMTHDDAEQKVVAALQQDIDELTEMLATLEEQRCY